MKFLFTLISIFCFSTMMYAQYLSPGEMEAKAGEIEAQSLYGVWLLKHGNEEEGLQ